MKIEIGIDTGGTFTDAVAYDTESKTILGWAKAPTTKEDLSAGIGEALDGLPEGLAGQAAMISLSTTLATNACVEDKGGRAKLLLIGMNPKTVAECGGEYGLPPAGEIWFLHSEGTMQGQILQEPDWDAFLRDSAAWFSDASAVAVVEVFAMWNGAALEKKARGVIAGRHAIPVVCGHDLFSDLNSLQRAAGTLLNARLIPIIEEFLAAVRRALDARDIAAPVAVVRSDGTLMSEASAVSSPVETLLCGPAASVRGAMELARERDAVIADMGGTTTDIALVKGGAPVRSAEGVAIGRWRTFVKGVRVETFGLGGDSAVRLDRHGALTLGPERVIPLSAAASRWSAVREKLEALTSSVVRHSEPLHEFYCLVRDIGERPEYTERERAFCAALRGGPLPLKEAAEASGNDAYHMDMRRLEREGVVIRAGLTPADIMHIRGDFTRYDAEAARLGAAFVAGCMDISVDVLCNAVYGMARKRLYAAVVRLLLEDRYPDYGRRGLPEGVDEMIGRAWDEYQAGQGGFFRFGFQTGAALVGVGAPVHVFLKDVAAALGTRAVVPEAAGVANALGAAAGGVSAEVAVQIGVDYSTEGVKGYIVYGKNQTDYVETLDEAVALARRDAERSAAEEVARRGAAGDITVVSEVNRRDVRVGGDMELLLDVAVTATARGGIAL
jgi:N-methylhydantoinase A/oxoprolinase/acetone carboxylase beta subunit